MQRLFFPFFVHLNREERNIFEAMAVGASLSIPIIVNVVVMMIAFVSIVSLFNGLLSWLGSMVDCPQLSFEVGFLTHFLFGAG